MVKKSRGGRMTAAKENGVAKTPSGKGMVKNRAAGKHNKDLNLS